MRVGYALRFCWNEHEANPNSHDVADFLGSHSHPTAEETLGLVTRTGYRFGPCFGPRYRRPFKLNVISNFNKQVNKVTFPTFKRFETRGLPVVAFKEANTSLVLSLDFIPDESERVCSLVNSPAHTFVDSHLRCLCPSCSIWAI